MAESTQSYPELFLTIWSVPAKIERCDWLLRPKTHESVQKWASRPEVKESCIHKYLGNASKSTQDGVDRFRQSQHSTSNHLKLKKMAVHKDEKSNFYITKWSLSVY